MNIYVDLLLLLLLIAANAMFAMAELAVVTSRIARLKILARKGNPRAKVALDMAQSPAKFLATVQVGITVVGIFAGAYGGVTLAERLAVRLREYELLAPYASVIAIIIVTGIISYLSLLSELVPKQIAIRHPERISIALASTMRRVGILLHPVIRILNISTEFLLKLLRIKGGADSTITDEEIKVIIEHATETGVFEQEERKLFEGVLALAETRVASLMTPRNEMDWLDLNEPLETLYKQIATSKHKRFAVGNGSLDEVVGFVNANTLYSRRQLGIPITLHDAIERPLFVPDNASALETLKQFKKERTHFALVLSEYGSIRGMLTINDVVEAIVGAIPTLHEIEEPGIIKRADGSFFVDGMMSIEEFKKQFNISLLPNEATQRYHTVGGFVISYLERIPVEADHFEWNGYRIEVVDMDGLRVDKILLTSPDAPYHQAEQ